MKIINRILKILDKLISFATIIFFISIMVIGCYALYDSYYIYDNAKLPGEIINLRLDDNTTEFSLQGLKEINEDICAWIRIDDTNIDYPVVIGEDNLEYINIDYRKEYSTSGSIFLDYRNDKDYKDDYLIIYGHNMKSDVMFGDIKKFEQKEYFDSHQYGTLYTDLGKYKIDIFCYAKVNAFQNDVYNLNVYNNGQNDYLWNLFSQRSLYKRDMVPNDDEKILLLSTCDTAGSSDRVVLVTKLTKTGKMDNNEVISDGNIVTLESVEAEKKQKNIEISSAERKKLNISVRKISLVILTIIVIIIFTILIVKKIKAKNFGKGKHAAK